MRNGEKSLSWLYFCPFSILVPLSMKFEQKNPEGSTVAAAYEILLSEVLGFQTCQKWQPDLRLLKIFFVLKLAPKAGLHCLIFKI